MYLRTLKAARSAKKFWEEIFMPKSQLGGGGGCLYFPLKHKSAMYTFVQQRGGGSRRDPNHKSMYKCAYMYVHLSLSPPPLDLWSLVILDIGLKCTIEYLRKYIFKFCTRVRHAQIS